MPFHSNTPLTPSGSVTLFKEAHPLKASLPTVFTVMGKRAEDKEVQSANTPSIRVVTPAGRTICPKEEQPAKAYAFSSVKPEGKVIFFRFSQPWNAESSMILTSWGISTDSKDLHPKKVF